MIVSTFGTSSSLLHGLARRMSTRASLLCVSAVNPAGIPCSDPRTSLFQDGRPTWRRIHSQQSHLHTRQSRLHTRQSRLHTRQRHMPLIGVRIQSMTVQAGTSDDGFEGMIRTKNSDNPVIVYSKTYCPYCSEVKSLFSKLQVAAKVVELDTLADGDAVQAALQGVSGMRTVPQVFIGGTLVGGCDDTLNAYNRGDLVTMLDTVGVSYKKE